MRNRNRCAAWLGVAGACLFAIGCGSDVPDPASDANAATGAPGGDAGAAPAPAVAAADAPKAEEAAPAAKPAEAPKDQAKGNSATSEMLALSGGANPPAAGGGGGGGAAPGPGPGAAPAAPGPGAPGPGGGAGPRMGPNAPGMQGGPGGGMSPGNMAGGPRMGPGSPGMQPQPDPNKMMAGMQNAMQQQMKNRGGAMMQPGPGGGGMGGPGGNAADTGPVDTHSPQGVVKAFLGALKSKDADRLVEATARRAASEATSSANRELFGKILEVSLSDSEMDDLAKKLDGYKISGENPPRSTAKVDVVIQKSGPNGSYMRRRVTTRHEKKGWGVLDISGEQVFKSIGARPGARKSSSR